MSKNEAALITLPVEDLRLLMETGYLYFNMKRLDEAREVFEGIVPLAPKSEAPHIALALLHYTQNRHEDAEREFRLSLELQPNSAYALANYGDFLFFHQRNAEALDALNRAITLDPNGPDGKLARSLLEAYQETKS